MNKVNMKILLLTVLIFGLAVSVNAQKNVLSGTVTDEFGSLIPGVKINAKNAEGKMYSTLTNNIGNYNLELTKGEYLIEFVLPPFDKFSISNYFVVQNMSLDIALKCTKCEVIEHNTSCLMHNNQVTRSKISNIILKSPLKEQNN